MSRAGQAHWTNMPSRKAYSTSTPQMPTHFDGHYLRNRSTLDIGVLGYIGIVWPKEHSPEVSHIPPVTPCIYTVCLKIKRLQFRTQCICVFCVNTEQRYFTYSELKKFFLMATQFGEPGESGILLWLLYPSDLRHFALGMNFRSICRNYFSVVNCCSLELS